jgi:hypothetical protein
MGINWGDAPTWIAGTFAGAAAIYARGMLKSQQKQIAEQRAFIAEQSANLVLEREALKAQAEERRYSQARQIEAMRFQNTLRVSNLSDAPITNAEVQFGDRYAGRAHRLVPTGSGINHEARGGQLDIPVEILGPGRTCAFVDSWDRRTEELAVLFFTDADGNRWQLDQNGKLDPA